MKEQNNEELKEEFCGACLAAPLAIAGVGTAGYGLKGNHSKNKKIILWVGVGITLLSVLIVIFYLMTCKKCR